LPAAALPGGGWAAVPGQAAVAALQQASKEAAL